jgi:hypothetical protein
MQKSILSLLQDEMVALANAKRELEAADFFKKQMETRRDAASVYEQQAEHARIQEKLVLIGAGLLA